MTQTTSNSSVTRREVPLAVWPINTTTSQRQGAQCPDIQHVTAVTRLTGELSPDLARRIITEYSEPGSLVVAPAVRSGAVVVEARSIGRRAVGVDNVVQLADVLGADFGPIDLIVTAPPDVGPPEADVHDMYRSYFDALRPGGWLVVVTRNDRDGGVLLDRAGLIVERCRQAGFSYIQHIVALPDGIRDSKLVSSASSDQLIELHRQRSQGQPVHLVVHLDVVAMRKVVANV